MGEFQLRHTSSASKTNNLKDFDQGSFQPGFVICSMNGATRSLMQLCVDASAGSPIIHESAHTDGFICRGLHSISSNAAETRRAVYSSPKNRGRNQM